MVDGIRQTNALQLSQKAGRHKTKGIGVGCGMKKKSADSLHHKVVVAEHIKKQQ